MTRSIKKSSTSTEKIEISLAVLDIDYFKKINDNYGHKVGDDVLIHFSKILKTMIRNSDICARYGGEEFVILLPYTKLKDSQIAAEKIRKEIESYDFPSVGQVTCSIGLAQKQENDTPEILYEKADKNLYSAKENGRNRVVS